MMLDSELIFSSRLSDRDIPLEIFNGLDRVFHFTWGVDHEGLGRQ